MRAGFSPESPPNSTINTEEKSVLDKMYGSELSLVGFVPLLFSLFYFMPLLVQTYTWQQYLLIVLAFCAFVPLYALCRLYESKAHYFIAVIVAISLAIGTVNWMSYVFLWYCAYLCGYLYSVSRALLANLALLVCIAFVWRFTQQPFYFFMAIASLPSVGLMLYGMFDRRIRREEAQKRERNKHIETLATIAERERLTRDMHDVLGHNLTALCLKARLAQKLGKGGDVDGALKEIAEVESIASTALNEVREAISQYKKRSLAEQLNALTFKLQESGFEVSCEISAEKIEARKESHFILILTEAVTNILRHSDGDKVSIALHENADGIVLRVADNGQPADVAFGNGIQGIKERVAEMQGRMDVAFTEGFVLQVQV